MYQFHIRGVVQGVGFRPYIYNACTERDLKGYVQNVGDGVVVVVDNRRAFSEVLQTIPVLSRIDELDIQSIQSTAPYKKFSIRASTGDGFAEIPPDLFLCADCYADLTDDTNRRYRYFFTTCTNCGPRYSMTVKNPYDRPNTSMNAFPMCKQCRAEYTDPSNRRFHAQTIACPDCGPTLKLIDTDVHSTIASDSRAIEQACAYIAQGAIVAIKGVGGFHLCSNTSKQTVERLRKLTKRKHKPYALLCKDVQMAQQIAYIAKQEKELLESYQRPIVALRQKKSLPWVSELKSLGVMLPYTALHYLLFNYLDEPLVMTSSNMSGAPITTTAGEQFCRYVLDHDRAIVNSVDDSVLKVISHKPLFIRRSRGYTPRSIYIDSDCPQTILALGAEQNTTIALYTHKRVYISPHIGTIRNYAVYREYKAVIETMLRVTQSTPDVIVTDAHPTYNSTKYGAELSALWNVPLVSVQHHLAHAYSVAAEHGIDDFTAIVADGLGFGSDGALWGGEVFDTNTRVGHLAYQPQLGGDSAAQHPAKMLYGIIRQFADAKIAAQYMRGYISSQELQILEQQYMRGINMPRTSSCGRILDAAAFLLGICDYREYEGRPAVLLDEHATKPYKINPRIDQSEGLSIVNTTYLFQWLLTHIDRDPKRLAATVLHYIASGLYAIASVRNKPIVWSGGCAYSKGMTDYLLKQGVLVNKQVPPGDGGISMGQIGWYLANSR